MVKLAFRRIDFMRGIASAGDSVRELRVISARLRNIGTMAISDDHGVIAPQATSPATHPQHGRRHGEKNIG